MRIGFPKDVKDGQSIVPAEFGKFTSFNLNGKFITRKDLPKEERVINTIYWEWKEWDGTICGKYCDVTRLCYPKDYIKPTLEKIFYNKTKGNVVSERILIENENQLLLVINIFLEIFKCCYITEDIDKIVEIQTVPWTIFPQGENPFSQENKLIKNFNRLSKREKQFVKDRIKTIENYNPDKIYIGNSYFRNYVAYVFTTKKITILECNSLDNATYVFDKKWEECSKLTKAEVLSKNLQKKRIVHNANWIKAIKQIMS